MTQFRVTLDPPYSFATESGFNLVKHCADFRPTKEGSLYLTDCYREPTTGLVMLAPSFLQRDWKNGLSGIEDFRTTTAPGFWQNVFRGIDDAPLFSSVKPNGSTPGDIAMPSSLYLPILAPGPKDTLVWTLESQTFTLKPDEGFAWYVWTVNEELDRHTNWFAFQWDNVLLHFSGSGLVHAYVYADRADLASPPALIDTFQIATPTQMHSQVNYFWCQPIPGLGLLIQHGSTPEAWTIFTSSATNVSVRGHLIPGGGTRLPNGNLRLFESSPIRFAQNPNYDFVLGFERIQFAASGTFTDAPFDIGYQPTPTFSAAAPLLTLSEQQGISVSVLDNQGVDPYPLHAQQGRVRASLTTTDTSYTPFLFGYNVYWPPVLANRLTTPIPLSTTAAPGTLDIANKIEFTQDEKGDFEGVLTCTLASAPAMAVAERGDATFLLETSEDGFAWSTLDGGFAKNWELEPISYMGQEFAYECSCSLHGLRERLRETYQVKPFALDGLTIAQANNNVLTSAGFAPAASYPADANTTTLPQSDNGKGWRFGGREGDFAVDLIDILMFLLRKGNTEYIERYNWDAQAWEVIAKPHDASVGATWSLSAHGINNAAAKVWIIGPGWKFAPEPPEANRVIVEGQETTDPSSQRVCVLSPAYQASLTDTTSVDYLGRYKTVKYDIPYVTDEHDLALMSLRILTAVKHRRLKAPRVPVPTLQMALAPNVHVQLLKPNGSAFWDGWIKKRTVIVEQYIDARMLLDLDTVWVGEIPR